MRARVPQAVRRERRKRRKKEEAREARRGNRAREQTHTQVRREEASMALPNMSTQVTATERRREAETEDTTAGARMPNT